MALTDKQQKFVLFFLETSNASEAVLLAGYKSASPDVLGAKLRKNPEISKLIEKNRKKLEIKTESSVAWVIEKLEGIGKAKLTDFCSWDKDGLLKLKASDEIDPKLMPAIESIKQVWSEAGPSVQIKLEKRTLALQLIGKHHGAFPDKVELGGMGGGAIELIIKDYTRNKGEK